MTLESLGITSLTFSSISWNTLYFENMWTARALIVTAIGDKQMKVIQNSISLRDMDDEIIKMY